jgi:hypothetical protein
MWTNFAHFVDVRVTGLLEQPVLHLAAASPAGRRSIEDAVGQGVGFALRRPLGPRWLRFLFPALLVHEADEEPVVFQVRRAWTLWPRWLVIDAEGERVGTVAGAWLLDRWDEPAFRHLRVADGAGGVFESPAGQKAAEWSRGGDRLRLVFHAPVQDEPFLKMLILARVLVGEH